MTNDPEKRIIAAFDKVLGELKFEPASKEVCDMMKPQVDRYLARLKSNLPPEPGPKWEAREGVEPEP